MARDAVMVAYCRRDVRFVGFREAECAVFEVANLELETNGARNERRVRRTDSVALAKAREGLAAIVGSGGVSV